MVNTWIHTFKKLTTVFGIQYILNKWSHYHLGKATHLPTSKPLHKLYSSLALSDSLMSSNSLNVTISGKTSPVLPDEAIYFLIHVVLSLQAVIWNYYLLRLINPLHYEEAPWGERMVSVWLFLLNLLGWH